MDQMSRKEAVTSLHRARIMTAAEKLFSEKGYAQTTIDDKRPNTVGARSTHIMRARRIFCTTLLKRGCGH